MKSAIVIGAGPGGYAAAIRLAQLGIDTRLVERQYVGGVCLNVGCIPSKALITASKQFDKLTSLDKMGIRVDRPQLDFPAMQAWKAGVVAKLTGGIRTLLKGNGVRLVEGVATIKGPGVIDVDGETLRADALVLAMGSRPVELPHLPIGGDIWSSTEALAAEKVPTSLAVVGGGYIGLELTGVFAKLGTRVTVVEAGDQLLPGFDSDLVQVVQKKLTQQGVEILLGAKAKGFADGILAVETAQGVRELAADKVLVTVGRRPNSEGLAQLGIQVSGQGFVVVDEKLQTSVPGIYAIGDLVGQPMLAHKAAKEADVVAEVIAGKSVANDTVAIPAVAFTDPEIASVGLSETEAKAKQLAVTIGKFPFAALGRALTTNEPEGFIKVVAREGDGAILGFHIVGPGASDLIGEGVLALEAGLVLDDVALTVHPHPTLTEGMMEAAKVALGEAVHALPAKKHAVHR